jgi:uncharacterized protein DUF3310
MSLTSPSPRFVDHPEYYGGDQPYEAVKVIRAWGLGFSLGNAVKYICRAGKKDPSRHVQDLEKAAWYIREEIAALKAGAEATPAAAPKAAWYMREEIAALKAGAEATPAAAPKAARAAEVMPGSWSQDTIDRTIEFLKSYALLHPDEPEVVVEYGAPGKTSDFVGYIAGAASLIRSGQPITRETPLFLVGPGAGPMPCTVRVGMIRSIRLKPKAKAAPMKVWTVPDVWQWLTDWHASGMARASHVVKVTHRNGTDTGIIRAWPTVPDPDAQIILALADRGDQPHIALRDIARIEWAKP